MVTKKQKQMDIDEILNQEEINMETGEITQKVYEDKSGKLGKVIITESKRKDGSVRITEDYSNCPSMTEQHGALTVQQLVDRYKPDELAAYLAAKEASRQPIFGLDFTQEPDLQAALNTKYHYQKYFNGLAPQIKGMFRTPLEFLKFMDNPANAEKMVEFGIFKKAEVKEILDTAPIKTPTNLDGSIEGNVTKKTEPVKAP